MIDKKKILMILIIIFLLALFIWKNFLDKDEQYEQLSFNEIFTETNTESQNITDKTNLEKIKVHITGEVNNPGLIEMDMGSRINDAIELAGGLTNQADTSKTNLAYILSDGEKIYIPNINDDENINSVDTQNSKGKININTATNSELKTIPGVGESTANSIIEYRNSNRKIQFNRRNTKCIRNRTK